MVPDRTVGLIIGTGACSTCTPVPFPGMTRDGVHWTVFLGGHSHNLPPRPPSSLSLVLPVGGGHNGSHGQERDAEPRHEPDAALKNLQQKNGDEFEGYIGSLEDVKEVEQAIELLHQDPGRSAERSAETWIAQHQR